MTARSWESRKKKDLFPCELKSEDKVQFILVYMGFVLSVSVNAYYMSNEVVVSGF